MKTFFIIAGVTVTILGVIAIAIISGVYIAVKFFGLVLTFSTLKKRKDEQQGDKFGNQ